MKNPEIGANFEADDIIRRVANAYDVYAEQEMKLLTEQVEQLMRAEQSRKGMGITSERAKQMHHDKYSHLFPEGGHSFENQVAAVTNNFWMLYLPEQRNLFYDEVEDPVNTSETKNSTKQIDQRFKDADEALERIAPRYKLTADGARALIENRSLPGGAKRTLRAKLIATLFFDMLDRGYDRDILWT